MSVSNNAIADIIDDLNQRIPEFSANLDKLNQTMDEPYFKDGKLLKEDAIEDFTQFTSRNPETTPLQAIKEHYAYVASVAPDQHKHAFDDTIQKIDDFQQKLPDILKSRNGLNINDNIAHAQHEFNALIQDINKKNESGIFTEIYQDLNERLRDHTKQMNSEPNPDIAYKRAKGALKEFIADNELGSAERESILGQAREGRQTDFAIIEKYHQQKASEAYDQGNMDMYSQHTAIAGKAGMIDQKIKDGDFTSPEPEKGGQLGRMTKDLVNDIKTLEGDGKSMDNARETQKEDNLSQSAVSPGNVRDALRQGDTGMYRENNSGIMANPDSNFERSGVNRFPKGADSGFHGPKSLESKAGDYIESLGQIPKNLDVTSKLTGLASNAAQPLSKSTGRNTPG